MQNTHAAGVIGRLGRLLARVGQVLVGEGFKTHKNARASGKCHGANQAGIVGDVEGYRGAPNFVQRLQRRAQLAQVVGARAQIIVDENCVRLPVGLKLRRDLRGLARPVGHAQTLGGQIAKPTAVVAAARGNQAAGGEEAFARQDGTAWGRVLAILGFVGRGVARLKAACFHVRHDARPKLDAVAHRQRVSVRRTFLGTRQHVQASQHHLAPTAAVPLGEFESPPRKCEVNGNAHQLRQRVEGWAAMQQIFVEVVNSPVGRRGGRKTRQRQRRSEHVLAKTRVPIFRVEGVDQQRVARLERARNGARVETRCLGHLPRNPRMEWRTCKRVLGRFHRHTLQYKVLCVKKNFGAYTP